MAVLAQDSAAAPAGDEIDPLFGYGSDEELTREFGSANNQRNNVTSNGNETVDAGIDEEVKVKKARKPVAKLDEERLLSQAGIPKLRRITKDRLKLKGKGHEFSDITRILNLYQLWLDDLYPRAKFTDGLAMIEKLGHTKRMQTMRRAWIDEGKPKDRIQVDEITLSREEENNQRHNDSATGATTMLTDIPPEDEDFGDDLFVRDGTGASKAMQHDPLDDDLDILLAEESDQRQKTTKDNSRKDDEDVPDELDALLAEDLAAPVLAYKAVQPADDDFADDMEAMGDAW